MESRWREGEIITTFPPLILFSSHDPVFSLLLNSDYNGETISRQGGFVQVIQSYDFGKQLGCENKLAVLQLTFLVEQIIQEYIQQGMLL